MSPRRKIPLSRLGRSFSPGWGGPILPATLLVCAILRPVIQSSDTPRSIAPTGTSPGKVDPPDRPGHDGRFGLWGAISRWIVSTPWVVYTLLVVNLGGAVAGYIYWYGSDILASPFYLWPFVPDSPLSATLLPLAFLAFFRGRRWELLGLMAATGCIKYGLWTDWYWFTNMLSGGRYTLEAIVLSLNHLGMALEGILLLPLLRPRLRHVLFVAAWYGLNDFIDYGMGRHPRIPNPEDLGLITWFAVASTIVICAVWLIWVVRRRRSTVQV